MRRCFVALDLPEEAKDMIIKIQDIIRQENLISGKFIEKENLHLTLKFLGEISEAQIEGIMERLNNIKFGKLKVRLGKVGMFGERIIWIELVEDVFELQRKVDESLEGMFERETRFMSHITIARPKEVKDKKKLIAFLSKIGVNRDEFVINEFSLKSSVLGRNGARYEDIFTKKLESRKP